MNQYIEYSKEVMDALQNKRPVVAIETGGTFVSVKPSGEKSDFLC